MSTAHGARSTGTGLHPLIRRVPRYLAFAATLAGVPCVSAPAWAASGPFVSLANTDFVVLLGFLLFVAVLLWFRAPAMIISRLDARAKGIRRDLDESKSLRDEAQALLDAAEARQRDAAAQAGRIVETARNEAKLAADQAREDTHRSLERRRIAAEEQIDSARAAALRDFRQHVAHTSIAATARVITETLTDEDRDRLIDEAVAASRKLQG